MDNESFGEEETTLFDVKRAEIGERRQIHFLQLHTVSSPARDRQGLNQGWLIVHSGEGKCWLVVASRRSVSEHCRQRIRILRHQLSQDGEGSVAVDWSEVGNVYSSPMYSRLTSQLNTIETNKTIIPDRHCFKKREIWLSFSRHSLLFITREESYLYG